VPADSSAKASGRIADAMFLLLALGFPALLLGLMLLMERVEAPLRGEFLGDHLAEFLDTARAEEVETLVSQGLAPALDRYWRRRRSLRIWRLTGRLPARG
jgi:hypothetical protein